MSTTSGSSLFTTKTTPSSSSSSSFSSSSIKFKGNGNSQACAACKYQRRKCAPDCVLAPYFPHHKQRQFHNAHKLFGIKNITRTIQRLDLRRDNDDAIRSIIFQSDARAADPVGGCYRIIQQLQRLIEYNKGELDIVHHQLDMCRAQTRLMQQITKEAGNITTCPDNQMINVGLYGDCMDQGGPYQQHLVADDMNNMWTTMQDSMSSSLHIKHGMNAADVCEDDIPCYDDDQRTHEIELQPDAIRDQSDEVLLQTDNINGKLKEDRQTGSASQQVQYHHHGDLKGEAALFMTLINCST